MDITIDNAEIKRKITEELNKSNFEKTKVFSLVISILALILVVLDPFISNLNERVFQWLFIFHLYLFTSTLILSIYIFVTKNESQGTQLAYIFAFIVAINSTIVSGVLDQMLGRGIIAYLFTIMGVSAAFYFNVTKSIIWILFCYIVFVTCLLLVQKDNNILAGNLINSSIFTLVTLFLFIVNYKRKTNSLRQSTIIEKQKEKIENQNETLSQTNDALQQRNAEVNQQKEEIEAQRDEIEQQVEVVSNQNRKITQSITYAKRIQTAVMDISQNLQKELPPHFIFFKPKDVVSGDFYFIKKIRNFILFAVADCTGHGVPGAFMSMLGIALLNDIVRRQEIDKANVVLEELRILIKASLQQTGSRKETEDGLDIAFCVFDETNYKLQYAGGNSPFFYIRNNEITEIKGDTMPVGIYFKETPFTNHELVMQKNDVIYLFSDGYFSQMGGIACRKFLSRNFKELLLSIHTKELTEQKTILETTINNWMAYKYEQIDDITVLGIRL